MNRNELTHTSTYCLSKLIVCILMLCVAFTTQSQGAPGFYEKMVGMPSQSLYDQGKSYQQSVAKPDSALVCFTILVDRAQSSKSHRDKQLCIKAYAEMAYIWYFHYYDYSKAIENMEKARELLEKWGEEVSQVPLYYGLMFGSIATQSNDDKTKEKALDYLKQAFHSAVKKNEPHVVNMAFSNLLSHAYSIGRLDEVKEECDIYRNNISDDPAEKYYNIFNLHMIDGLTAQSNRQYDKALEAFDSMLAELPKEPQYCRYHCGAWEFKGLINQEKGDLAAAEQAFRKALQFAEDNGLQDAKVEIYHDLSQLYKLQKRENDHIEYENKYLSIKDSLLSYQQISAIDEMHFLGDLRAVENRLQATSRKNARMAKVLIFGGILLITAFAIIWFTMSMIRKLKRSNRALFSKNEEVFKAQEEEHRLRTRYESELQELKQQLEAAKPQEPEQPQKEVNTKYSGSKLSDDEKQIIADRIRNVMETSQEIYSTDFSSERLADLVGEKYKYVSQVINEIWNVNFNTLLNNFRIREACKRITDETNYKHFTMEALAETVGFKSRSTFVVQFKRVTGLTPSQYINESRKG